MGSLVNIVAEIGIGYASSLGSGCECVEATEEEILEILAKNGLVPALMVDEAILCIDDKILII